MISCQLSAVSIQLKNERTKIQKNGDLEEINGFYRKGLQDYY